MGYSVLAQKNNSPHTQFSNIYNFERKPTLHNIQENIDEPSPEIIDEFSIVDTLNQCSKNLLLRDQNFPKALELSREAERIAESIDYQKGLGWALVNQAKCLIHSDLSNETHNLVRRSLRIFQYLNDTHGETISILLLGMTHLIDGEYISAHKEFEQGLKLSKFSNNRKNEKMAYHFLASLSRKLEDYKSSVKYNNLALAIPENSDFNGRVLTKLGQTLVLMDKTDQAKFYLEEALKHSEKINDKFSKAYVYVQLGKIYAKEGKNKKARKTLKKGLNFANEIGLFDNSGLVADEILETYIELQDYRSALEILDQFLKNDKINENPHRLSMMLMKRVSIKLKMKKYNNAINLLKQIWEAEKDGKNTKILSDCQKGFADIYEIKKDYKKALKHYQLFNKYKEEFDNIGTADKIKVLADRINIENLQQINEVTKTKNSEVAKMVYEIHENLDKLQKAEEIIINLRAENERLQGVEIIM